MGKDALNGQAVLEEDVLLGVHGGIADQAAGFAWRELA